MIPTMLESFPDEILLHVFDYFSIRDLYHSFSGLNARLDAVVCSRKNLAVVFSSPDEMDDSFCDVFTPCIVKLTVDHSSYFDFDAYSSLQSLILNSPSDDQMEQIYHCHLPYLTHLEFGIMSNTLSRRALHAFLRCEQFPSLQTCIFHPETNAVSSNPYQQIWSNPSTLRTVWLNSADLSLRPDHGSMNREKIIYGDVMHINLKRFDFCCLADGPSVVQIDHILRQMPKLEKLKIASTEVYYSYEFLQQLAAVLERRLTHLREFACELLCIMTDEEREGMARLHPSFKRIQYESKYGGQCTRLFTEQ